MTGQSFKERFDALLEEYILENDDYEDIDIVNTQSWRGLPHEWLVEVSVRKQKK